MVDAAEGGRQTAFVFRFSADVFSLDAVKRAAYRFTNHYSFEFEADENDIQCIARSLAPVGSDELESFEARFRNAVLDQDLRQRIALETAPLRNAILAHAFSGTGLQDVE